jgi:hypothetical protein
MPEVLDRRSLGKCALGPQVRHLQGPLQRQAGGHDFAENVRHGVPVQGSLVPLDDALEHLGLALRTVIDSLNLFTAVPGGGCLLEFYVSHALGTARPTADQRLYLLVYGIDVCPDLFESPVVGLFRHLCPSRCVARSPA